MVWQIKKDMRSIRRVMAATCFNIRSLILIMIDLSASPLDMWCSNFMNGLIIRMPRMGYSSISLRAYFFCSINM